MRCRVVTFTRDNQADRYTYVVYSSTEPSDDDDDDDDDDDVHDAHVLLLRATHAVASSSTSWCARKSGRWPTGTK